MLEPSGMGRSRGRYGDATVSGRDGTALLPIYISGHTVKPVVISSLSVIVVALWGLVIVIRQLPLAADEIKRSLTSSQ